jgi:hypothetical protein
VDPVNSNILRTKLSFNSWKVPSDLPRPVLEWLQGQKQILFADVAISSFTDISKTYADIADTSKG